MSQPTDEQDGQQIRALTAQFNLITDDVVFLTPGRPQMRRDEFAAQFRAATGMRPHEYLLFRRIAHARELLATSQETLVDIALGVGFQTQAHFTTVFKRFVGATPSPAFAAQVSAEYQRLLDLLDDPEWRSVAVWKMEGHTTAEIARMLGCVPRTVERKLRVIRSLWHGEGHHG